jgi:hypothetical protein
MASSLVLSVGALEARLDWADDAKVQATLLKFHEVRGLGEADDPAQEKLDSVVAEIRDQILRIVTRHERERRAALLDSEIAGEYDLE